MPEYQRPSPSHHTRTRRPTSAAPRAGGDGAGGGDGGGSTGEAGEAAAGTARYDFGRVLRALGTKVIVLDRLDLVGQYVSPRRGAAAGRFDCGANRSRACARAAVRVTPRDLVARLRRREREDASRDARLAALGLPVLRVTYEQCAQLAERCFEEVLGFFPSAFPSAFSIGVAAAERVDRGGEPEH